MCRVERRAAEDAGVQIALAGSHSHVEERDAARRDLEDRNAGLEHVPIEDHASVSSSLVGLQEVDDRMAAALLLAVTGEPHVHGQRALGCEERRGLEQEVELALVVGDAARIEPAVPDRRLERRALPSVERIRRLNVEVTVRDDGRRGVGIL